MMGIGPQFNFLSIRPIGARYGFGPQPAPRSSAVAPTFDAVSSGSANGVSSITISHVVGTGTDRILLVGASTDPVDMTPVPTATYNGVSMTAVPSGLVAAGINRAQWFYLLNPASGTHDIVISWTGGNSYIVAGGISFSGVSQSNPLGTAATNSGTSTTASVDVTSSSTAVVVDCLAFDRTGTTTATCDASQTQQWNIAVTADKRGAASTKSGASTTTMSWTLSNSRAFCIVGVGVNGE